VEGHADTFIMVGATMASAIVIGTPLGVLFVTTHGGCTRGVLNRAVGYLVNVLRCFLHHPAGAVDPVLASWWGPASPEGRGGGAVLAVIPYFARLVSRICAMRHAV
jgi:hypothetical protein